jgi:hypothetical protein
MRIRCRIELERGASIGASMRIALRKIPEEIIIAYFYSIVLVPYCAMRILVRAKPHNHLVAVDAACAGKGD